MTLITLTQPPSPGDWDTSVACLVTDSVRAGRPMFHVQVGGDLSSFANATALDERLGSPLLLIDRDKDVLVRGPFYQGVSQQALESRLSRPTTIDGAPCYTCCIPSLRTIAPALAEHERRHGPSLVILDDLELARPYQPLLPDPERLQGPPGGLDVPAAVLGGWLATDVDSFAVGRPLAPTVAVWHSDGWGLDVEAVRAVCQLDIVSNDRTETTSRVTWRGRTDLCKSWGPRESRVVTRRSTP